MGRPAARDVGDAYPSRLDPQHRPDGQVDAAADAHLPAKVARQGPLQLGRHGAAGHPEGRDHCRRREHEGDRPDDHQHGPRKSALRLGHDPASRSPPSVDFGASSRDKRGPGQGGGFAADHQDCGCCDAGRHPGPHLESGRGRRAGRGAVVQIRPRTRAADLAERRLCVAGRQVQDAAQAVRHPDLKGCRASGARLPAAVDGDRGRHRRGPELEDGLGVGGQQRRRRREVERRRLDSL